MNPAPFGSQRAAASHAVTTHQVVVVELAAVLIEVLRDRGYTALAASNAASISHALMASPTMVVNSIGAHRWSTGMDALVAPRAVPALRPVPGLLHGSALGRADAMVARRGDRRAAVLGMPFESDNFLGSADGLLVANEGSPLS